MKTKIICMTLFTLILIAGCGEPVTSNVDTINDEGGAVTALDYRDFERAASKLTQSLLGSGRLKKADGGRYLIVRGRIICDTTQYIDANQLMMRIETDLTNSGLAAFTAMVGTNKDETLMESRELRDSDEFNQNTTVAKGTAIAPELSIAGKIFQKSIKVSNKKQRIEYHFFLQLSEVETGITFWQDEVTFVKETTDKSLPM